MSSRNHNSIIFLTTLGVYLGLVLVGATPLVAQTSELVKTSQSEIPRVSPGGDSSWRNLSESLSAFFLEIERNPFLKRELQELNSKPFYFEVQHLRSFVTDGCPPSRYLKLDTGNTNLTHKFRDSFPQIAERFFVHGLLEKVGKYQFTVPNEMKFRVSDTGFEITLSAFQMSDQEAVFLSDELGKSFARKAAANSKIEKLTYSNTEVHHKNNQVFIVTRLPRAGLESLLAKDAK